MEKYSADSPFDQTIEQYKRDLMSVYRRSRAPARPADPGPARTEPAVQETHPPVLEETSNEPASRPDTGDQPETAQLPTLGEFLRERIGNPPDNSGTPRDAIGRNEEEYLTAAAAFLRELLAQFAPGSKPPESGSSPEGEAQPETAQLPTLGEFLRERIGNPPDNSGTPRDAIGRNEEEYLTAAAAFLRELLAQAAEKNSSANTDNHTTNDQNFQPSAGTKGEYDQFRQDNPDSGVIKTQVFTARRTFPVENAQVNLYKVFPDGAYLIDSQFTDSSGQVDPVTVPALERSLSETPGDPAPYVSYRITVSHPDFVDAVIEQVPVFEGVVSLQAVDLIPTAAAPVPDQNGKEEMNS